VTTPLSCVLDGPRAISVRNCPPGRYMVAASAYALARLGERGAGGRHRHDPSTH